MADRPRRGFLLPGIALVVFGLAFAGGAFMAGDDTGPALATVPAVVAAVPPSAGDPPGAASPAASALPAPAGPVEPGASTAQEPLRILVSIESRRLWLVEGQDTLLRAPVAIGMSEDFTFDGREYRFATPRGRRTVIGKEKDPVWIPPEWHYFEKAASLGLGKVVRIEEGSWTLLGDSSYLVVQDGQVGRINHFGYFSPFTPGTEIIFDGVMYIPPSGTAQRKVPDALGPYKLDMGDGYLIHGTHLYNEDSIGQAVSHGCVRMRNEDLVRLYPLVPTGTPVIIF